jgi:hypothetical protein
MTPRVDDDLLTRLRAPARLGWQACQPNWPGRVTVQLTRTVDAIPGPHVLEASPTAFGNGVALPSRTLRPPTAATMARW